MVDGCFVATQSETRLEPSTHLVFDCNDIIQHKSTLDCRVAAVWRQHREGLAVFGRLWRCHPVLSHPLSS
jgi:hypothetical protein